ncbi:MAG: type IX secretion system membrane protein PorP/SprF [Flavobacteriales bacterium]
MKNMKKIAILALLAIAGNAYAQQDPQYSMYMFNNLAINPAYAGSLEGINASVLYRTQWTGIPGAPKTLVATAHKNFFNEKIGGGISFFNDQIGVMDRNTISLAGSYHLHLEKSRISFGIQANYSQYNVGLQSVQHSLDGSFDPTFSSNLSMSTINVGAGVFYYSEKIFAGISSPSIFKNNISPVVITGATSALEVPHLFAQLGYIWEIDPLFTLKPSVLVRQIEASPLLADINANLYYKKIIGLGVGYRTNGAAIAMLECQVHPFLKLGYAYDREMTDLGVFALHTHEIMLRFQMGMKGTQISPRLY